MTTLTVFDLRADCSVAIKERLARFFQCSPLVIRVTFREREGVVLPSIQIPQQVLGRIPKAEAKECITHVVASVSNEFGRAMSALFTRRI